MESLFSDVRYAFRVIRKSPGFTAMVVISLALGIGANTAIFTLIHAVMLKPLPVADPDGLDNVKSEAMLALWDAFQREGIRVPYPVREIRLRGALPVDSIAEASK